MQWIEKIVVGKLYRLRFVIVTVLKSLKIVMLHYQKQCLFTFCWPDVLNLLSYIQRQMGMVVCGWETRCDLAGAQLPL